MSTPDSLAISVTVPTCKGPVTVKEITTGEIRALMASLSLERPVEVVDYMLVEGWDLRELAAFVVGGQQTLDSLPPSELHPVIQAVQEVNPDFFGMRERYLKTVMALSTPAPTSNGPSAP